jgi:DNA topoisomerase-2
VIPWLLVNGCVGIATGFSTTVPMHDVRDICARMREYIVDRTQGSPLAMRVTGYTGVVTREAGRYTTSTVVTRAAAKGAYVVSELPVGVWTDAYKARLDALIDKKAVTKYTNESTDVAVRFVVHTAEPAKLAMSKHTSTANMHALDSDGALVLWTVEAIVEYFCAFRAPFYAQRKASIARALRDEIEKKQGTLRFIELVLSGGATAIFLAADAAEAIKARGFREDVLDTPLRACTQERRARLERDLAALQVALERHEAVAPVDTWLAEIDALAGSVHN